MTSSRSSLTGKNILFINSGGKKKTFTLERAKELGATVILVNQRLDVRKKTVDHFIAANTYDHDEVIEKIHTFLKLHPEITLDGAITFWEDDIPVLGRVCEEFDLVGNSLETAIRTRNKHEMRKRLQETGLGHPQFHLAKTYRDLAKACDLIGFPAVLKPAWGSDSEFVVLVQNRLQAEPTFRYLLKNCTEQFNPIFKYNHGMFLYEEYMEGVEVSAECFVQYGIPHVIGINEKEPMKPPYFVECGDIVPARLGSDEEQGVTKLAESSLIALGVTDSLAHIEIKITPDGPKIVEVASRMGGDDIHLYVEQVWGVNMVDLGLEIACGVRAEFSPSPPSDCIMSKYFIPDQSGVVSTIQPQNITKQRKHTMHLKITKNIGDAILVPPEGFETAGWLCVKGRSYQQAEVLLGKLLRSVKINVTPFRRDSTLGKTSRENALDTASVVRSRIMKASRLARIRHANSKHLRDLHIGIVTNSPFGESTRKMLSELGYRVTLFDMSETPPQIRKIQASSPDLVLNICETHPEYPFFRSNVAALLEMLQLPFTGSSTSTVAMAMDKITVKKLLDYHEIPTPKWDYVDEVDESISEELDFPLIVKPSNTDDYQGITWASVVKTPRELKRQIRFVVEELKRPALIEEYIDGDELDVCILGNGEETEVFPVIRSVFSYMPKKYRHIYTADLFKQEHRRALDAIRIEKPAKIPAKLNTLISEMALDIYHIFDCRDYAKIEMRMDSRGNPFVLELNTHPTLDPKDFFAMAARLGGYSYEDLLETVILIAAQRYREHEPSALLSA